MHHGEHDAMSIDVFARTSVLVNSALIALQGNT